MAGGTLILDAVSDGKHVIIGMLLTGLVFLGVIAIGEGLRAAGRRRERKRRTQAV